jgi:hypothetical protein
MSTPPNDEHGIRAYLSILLERGLPALAEQLNQSVGVHGVGHRGQAAVTWFTMPEADGEAMLTRMRPVEPDVTPADAIATGEPDEQLRRFAETLLRLIRQNVRDRPDSAEQLIEEAVAVMEYVRRARRTPEAIQAAIETLSVLGQRADAILKKQGLP